MSYTPAPLKVRYGTAVEPWHSLSLFYHYDTPLPQLRDTTKPPVRYPLHFKRVSGLGQMTWPGFFGMEPHILAAASFAAGALTMHMMHRYRVLGMNRRRRRRR